MSLTALAAVSIGLHLGSAHVPQHQQNNVNPGLYLRVDDNQVGFYRNSYGRTTVYAGHSFPVGPVELMVGVASGYDKRCSTTSTDTVHTETEAVHGYGKVTRTYTTTETHTTCEGFSKHALTPLAAISYVVPVSIFNARPRIWFMPGISKASSVAHVSLEWSLK